SERGMHDGAEMNRFFAISPLDRSRLPQRRRWLAAGVAALVGLAATAASAEDWVIRNATVMTVANGTLEGAAVWVRDGRIAGVEREVAAPPGARVIDAGGRF